MTTESTPGELRKTGIGVIGDVCWGTHFCCFYETKQDLLDTLVSYFKAGLENKEFCLCVISRSLIVEARHALKQTVLDFDRHLAEGGFEIHSQDDWYLGNGQFDPQRAIQGWREKLDHAVVSGYTGLRASGDGGWVQGDEWMVFREYEKQVDALVADRRKLLLCTYPLTTSLGDQVFDVAHIHQMAVARRNGSWELIETPELREGNAEISRLNDALERKIEERTRELATTNQALRSEIAERRLAEEAVKQAEDRIRLVIDTIPTMVWSLRPDGVVDFVNQRWLRYTGLSFEHAITEPNCIVHPEDVSRVVEKWLKDMAAGKPSEDEMRLRRGDGEYRWFLIHTVPQVNEQGDILKWYGAATDIEDRKRAEGALNAQVLRYKTLMETSTDSIYVVDQKGDLQEANAAFLRGRGYTLVEAKGLNIADWDAQWSREELQKRLRDLVGGSEVFETRHRCKDGSVFDVEVCATSVRIGSEQLFFAVTRDITERKQADEYLRETETRFRQLAENIDTVFWLSNPEGTLIHYISPAYERIWGRSCDTLYAHPMSWMDSIHSDDHERVAEDERVQLVSGQHDHTYRIIRPDGSLRWIRDRAFPVRDELGKLIRIAGIAEDITERKQAEQALRESETKFRGLLASNITGVVFWTLDGDISGANDRFLNMVGYTREDLRQGRLSWKKLTPPEYAPVDEKAIGELIATGTCSPFEKEYICKDGGRVSVLIGSALLEPHKESGSSFVMDITERKRVEVALDERLRFETLLTELSAAFANLPTTKVDQEIDKWLQNLVEFLDLDRAILDQVGEDGVTLSRSHSHTIRGIDTGPLDVANDHAPWITEQLLKGNTVKWSRIPHDVPEGASKEREFAGRIGAKSLLSIPVCIGGSVICAVSFTSLRIYRDWPDEMVAQLRLVGEIFANAIARKRAAKEVEEANHQLRFLSRRLFHLQEEERSHLARELHDEVGQTLTAAKINLQTATKESDPAKSKRIDETAAILERLLGQVRQISLDLRPSTLDDLGLVPALRSLLNEQGRRALIAVRFSAENVPENLSPEIQTTCFRIAQEAITNAVRHANATQIDVDLGCENGNLRLQVRDNGRGFDPHSVQWQTTGLGLIGIKERAALVEARAKIISSPNNGTTVEVSLPLTFPAEREGREIGK
jgi:PAS domain S-box-containing protein